MTLDWNELKKPDLMQAVNIKMMQKLYKTINNENEGVKPETVSYYFIFCVSYGNSYTGIC